MSINHTFSTLCIIRSSRSKNDKAPVYLRITVDGKRSEISTKEYVELDKWNRDKGRMKGSAEHTRSLNRRLDTWETKAKDYHNEFLRDGKRVSAQAIKNLVLGIAEKNDDLMSFFEMHEQEVKTKIGIDYSPGTHKNYVATSKHLKNFLAKRIGHIPQGFGL
ncbi:MAG: Arm DNA-binding domain-containing protein [Cyclobacteriaceae bacterium]